eukprot:TRINITY_DN9007_c0_g1_i1.p1 TRINITY_DN9007_c0_g1~~TRINITY_DN9007_c0_g1_i1.p1  ORF type:complete len:320 (+),score=74.83 TRINITY_DN9007_c0_g1_i1:55-1014(+)
MKYVTLLFIISLSLVYSLSITFAGDITASLGSTLNADVNLGIQVGLGLSDIFTLSSSSKVTGTVTLGSQSLLGLIASTPTLNLNSGVVLNCSQFVLNGGRVQGDGQLVVTGEATLNTDSTVNAAMTAKTITVNAETNFQKTVSASSALVVNSGGSGTVFASLSVPSASSVTINADSSVSGDFSGGSNSRLVINGGSLTVSGAASFASDATYTVYTETASSSSVLIVTGQATMRGNLVVMTDLDISAGTEVVIMKYGSRASASAFSSVSVQSSSGKRTVLSEDDYEVVYYDNEAVVTKNEGETGTTPFILGTLMAFLAMI